MSMNKEEEKYTKVGKYKYFGLQPVLARCSWISGCGKSFLVATVFHAYPVLLSRYYEHVIWVEDGHTAVCQLSEVFSNFVFLAADALVLTGKETLAQFLPLAKTALREKPNTLVILNDIYLQESVRWFDQLNCRILATSRNLEIFQVSSSNPIHFKVDPPGFSLTEMEEMFQQLHSSTTMVPSSYNEHLFHIYKETMGLPALLGIVRQQACDSHKDFHNLCCVLSNHSIATISNFTYYKHKNMTDAIMESYKSLVSLCIPFDISGDQDILYMVLRELEPLVKSSLLDKRIADLDNQADSNTSLMYDFCINRIMHSFLCITVDRQMIEDRLRLFIRPNMFSFLLGYERINSNFLQRVRSYMDICPSLFQEIAYEDCSSQTVLIKKCTEDNSHTWYKHYSNGSDYDQIIRRKSSDTARNWTDSCIFM
ncbi:hypothetical protein DINM_002901 [Dirofilaria immitis]|nr:hypothetical protein [Dirofilaria immitis]